MRLWNVHDDPENNLQAEEREWALVWADNERDAKLLAAAIYRGETYWLDASFEKAFVAQQVTSLSDDVLAQWKPKFPRIERRQILHRLCGWSEEGEQTCDSCGLAALNMPQFAVCPECNLCAECGCECEVEL